VIINNVMNSNIFGLLLKLGLQWTSRNAFSLVFAITGYPITICLIDFGKFSRKIGSICY